MLNSGRRCGAGGAVRCGCLGAARGGADVRARGRAGTVRECVRARVVARCAKSGAAANCDGSAAPTMATLGLSKVFILDKYFTELQKFWETEKKLQGELMTPDPLPLCSLLLDTHCVELCAFGALSRRGRVTGSRDGGIDGSPPPHWRNKYIIYIK